MSISVAIDQLADAIGEINSIQTPAKRLVGGGVVVDSRGRLLIAFSDFAFQGWHFPKGGLDEGETSLEGALREVHEESGGVLAKPFSGNVVFSLNPGRVYHEPIGFGSSRLDPPHKRTSDKISLGAMHLLEEAAREARVDLELLNEHRYQIFDTLVARGIRVAWVTVPTYHLMSYIEGQHGPTDETQVVEWHSPKDIQNLRAPNRPHGKPRLSGATRSILSWPNIVEHLEGARLEANAAFE
jgi:8-oxo-dGTP pyrophosphatase MutT (NUDIX family)